MNEGKDDLLQHALGYAAARGIEITEHLGWGIHGSVWKITGKERSLTWVLKLHLNFSPWRRERDCYRRLQETGTSSITGVHVPQLIWEDEECLAIEMSLVKRPFRCRVDGRTSGVSGRRLGTGGNRCRGEIRGGLAAGFRRSPCPGSRNGYHHGRRASGESCAAVTRRKPISARPLGEFTCCPCGRHGSKQRLKFKGSEVTVIGERPFQSKALHHGE